MIRSLSTSAIALVLGAAPALADVTPSQVWDNLRQSYEDMGYQVQVGDQQEAGETLTLSDITLRSQGDEAADSQLTIPRLVMQQSGADVRSVIEGQMTLEIRDTNPEGQPAGFALTLDASGNETLSSGTPEAMDHRYAVPELKVQGRALDERNDSPVTMTFTDVEGQQSIRRAEDGGSQQSYDATAAEMVMALSGSGPSEVEGAEDATDTFTANVTISDLAITGTGTLPGGVDFGADPAAALAAGFRGEGNLQTGPLNLTFQSSTTDSDGQAQDANGTVSANTGRLAVSMTGDGLTYEGRATDMQTQVTSTEMPFPLAYATAENAFRLTVPTVARPDEQPFALSYVLDGLTLDDAVWQSFDPQNTLPRDPASLTIDIEGQTVVTQSFLDPAFGETGDEPQIPFLPRSLNIRDISLAAIGASADLSGQLTFGDDPTQPVGSIEGTFTGINGLMDNLVAMGLVPQEQLMGARMMLAMFARPVEGNPEQLQTQLEFREGGSIFANGQQVR
ncbi:MAG: DUF2125 domain-containing protein [Alphaproteobacteria bacterium]|nr:DUF2125 domain-containing protein [Alphaproteobacteria bacterium]